MPLSWADIPVTNAGVSPSQVKELPPVGTALALDLPELFWYGTARHGTVWHGTPVRHGYMGQEEETSGRDIQALQSAMRVLWDGDVFPPQEPRLVGERWPRDRLGPG